MKAYTDIDVLPIWNYNKVVDSGDLKWLLIEPNSKVNEAELSSVWSSIINQYIAATSHREGNRDVYQLQHQAFELMVEYNNIQMLCFALRHDFKSEYVAKLSEYGYDIETINDLPTVLKRSNNIQTQRRAIEITLAERVANMGENVTFETILDRISQHQGIRLNPRQISVKEWIAIEDNYINDLKNKRNANK